MLELAVLLDAYGEPPENPSVVPVTLEAHLTEVGTLELWCHAAAGEGRWRLEYEVRER